MLLYFDSLDFNQSTDNYKSNQIDDNENFRTQSLG